MLRVNDAMSMLTNFAIFSIIQRDADLGPSRCEEKFLYRLIRDFASGAKFLELHEE
jgi:hypothetical protein